jgi:hypothetical protein
MEFDLWGGILLAPFIGICVCLVFALIVISMVRYFLLRPSTSNQHSTNFGILNVRDTRFGDERQSNFIFLADPQPSHNWSRSNSSLFKNSTKSISTSTWFTRIYVSLLLTILGIICGYTLFQIYSLFI